MGVEEVFAVLEGLDGDAAQRFERNKGLAEDRDVREVLLNRLLIHRSGVLPRGVQAILAVNQGCLLITAAEITIIQMVTATFTLGFLFLGGRVFHIDIHLNAYFLSLFSIYFIFYSCN